LLEQGKSAEFKACVEHMEYYTAIVPISFTEFQGKPLALSMIANPEE
jgi:hypothetical protein